MSPSKKNDDLSDLDSFSKRLKYIVDTEGVKQSHMASKLGLSASGLHYILNNDVKFSKNAKKIAKYLNVNESWLLKGEGEVFAENKTIKTYRVPVYYPDQLKLSFKSKQPVTEQVGSYAITTTAYTDETMGIYITETDFAPKFEVGDIVVFEKDEAFQNGEIILVYLQRSNQIVLRYGYQIKGSYILLSTQDVPMELNLTQGDKIIGAYRECFKKTNF